MRISQETLSMVPPGGEVPTKPGLPAATPGLGATLGTCSKWGSNQARFCTHNQLSSWKGQPVEMSIRNRMFAHVGWGENGMPGNLSSHPFPRRGSGQVRCLRLACRAHAQRWGARRVRRKKMSTWGFCPISSQKRKAQDAM